jgi:hypothetical protein
MDAMQRQVVDGSDAIVLAESGNSFVWATHRLALRRRRAATAPSTGVGAMGHAAAGVVGAALGRRAPRRRESSATGAMLDAQRDQHRPSSTARAPSDRPQRRPLRHVRAGHERARLVRRRTLPRRRLRRLRARARAPTGCASTIRELDAALRTGAARRRARSSS